MECWNPQKGNMSRQVAQMRRQQKIHISGVTTLKASSDSPSILSRLHRPKLTEKVVRPAMAAGTAGAAECSMPEMDDYRALHGRSMTAEFSPADTALNVWPSQLLQALLRQFLSDQRPHCMLGGRRLVPGLLACHGFRLCKRLSQCHR